MVYDSITSWQIKKEKVKAVTDFIFLSSKINADGDCSYEIKWHLLLGRKGITKLERVLKSRRYIADKGPYSQSSGFSHSYVSMWELEHKEGWGPKNWCFWIVVWRRLLRVPWIARISNQSILKEINLEYSLEGLLLKRQYFGHLMQRAISLEKTLILGKNEGKRRWGWQRMRWLNSFTD